MKLTEAQIKLFRMASGEFDGLTTAEIGDILHISPQAVNKRLRVIEGICPELFPLLTKREAEVYSLYERAGWSVSDVSAKLGISESRVYAVLTSLSAKGRLNATPDTECKVLSYDPGSHDNQIREKY